MPFFNPGQNTVYKTRIGGWLGHDRERMKSYSAAVIDGIKRKSRISVRHCIDGKTDSRLDMG